MCIDDYFPSLVHVSDPLYVFRHHSQVLQKKANIVIKSFNFWYFMKTYIKFFKALNYIDETKLKKFLLTPLIAFIISCNAFNDVPSVRRTCSSLNSWNISKFNNVNIITRVYNIKCTKYWGCSCKVQYEHQLIFVYLLYSN